MVAGIADHRQHLAIAERRAAVDHGCQQGEPYSALAVIGRHIDRILDRVTIGDPRPVAPDIGVAGDSAVELGKKVGQASFLDGAPARVHLAGRRRIDLEGAQPVQHKTAIDFRDRRHVPSGRIADQQVRRHLRIQAQIASARVAAQAAAAIDDRVSSAISAARSPARPAKPDDLQKLDSSM